MNFIVRVSFLYLFIFSIFVVGCGAAADPVAVIESFTGEVAVSESESGIFKKPEPGQTVVSGGVVRSEEESSANLKFLKDQTIIKIAQNTHFEIKNFSEKELKQMSGIAIYQVSPQNVEMKIQTPHGIATVLGTTFILDVAATNTALIVEKGKVGFKNEQGEVIVEAGKEFVTGIHTAPVAADPFKLGEMFTPGANLKKRYNQR